MKLTATQLRQIIKEEVQKTLGTQTSRKRSLRESPEMEAYIEIPGVEEMAEYRGETVEQFEEFIQGLASQHGVDVVDPSGGPAGGSLVFDDTLSVQGSLVKLGSFAKALDKELMGGAQSVEDSFEDRIQSHY